METLGCHLGPDSHESGPNQKHVSGTRSDGRAVEATGKALGRMKPKKAAGCPYT
jgi:hypothetical protein